MILFIARTWTLWWICAVAAILRWFHVLSANAAVEVHEKPASSREKADIVSV